jgi:Predicted hydrolase of the alpha/beta superfamily
MKSGFPALRLLLIPAAFGCATSTRGAAPVVSSAAVEVPGADSVLAHETFTIQSAVVGETRRINVYTPPQYRGTSQKFPVLYMPDGGLDEDFPHVIRTVDSLIALHAIRPIIVVGIPNTQRRRDLTGPTRVKSDSAIAPRVGGSADFRRFIGDELIPEINRRYRTTSERGIMGESLAGLFIVETFLEKPDMFTHYIAFDPSVWWNSGALIDSSASLIAKFDANPRTLYLATSKEPSTAVGIARLDSLLHSAPPHELRWTYEPRVDLEHSTIFRAVKPKAIVDAFRQRS